MPETKHFELVQGVINRLANNQLVCKGWAITVVAAAAALTSQKDAQWYFTVAAALPPAFFWWLDAYYLQHERKFRALYQELVVGSDHVLPMSMDIRRYGGAHPLRRALTSWQVAGFYLVLILVVMALGLLKRGV